MNTIMMLKICRLLPDMYIMIAFIGRAFAGASASSHAFLSLSVSVAVDTGEAGEEAEEVSLLRVLEEERWRRGGVSEVGGDRRGGEGWGWEEILLWRRSPGDRGCWAGF